MQYALKKELAKVIRSFNLVFDFGTFESKKKIIEKLQKRVQKLCEEETRIRPRGCERLKIDCAVSLYFCSDKIYKKAGR